jgi:predicted Zn-dependent peptidase
MNSRLNVSLREKRGLVYTVDMSTSICTDVGSATVYFGCDPKDFNKCHQLVSKEIDAFSSFKISQRTLDAAKRQYMGQLVVGSENRESMIMGCARSQLLKGKVQSRKEIMDRLNAITTESLKEASKWFSTDRMSTLILV